MLRLKRKEFSAGGAIGLGALGGLLGAIGGSAIGKRIKKKPSDLDIKYEKESLDELKKAHKQIKDKNRISDSTCNNACGRLGQLLYEIDNEKTNKKNYNPDDRDIDFINKKENLEKLKKSIEKATKESEARLSNTNEKWANGERIGGKILGYTGMGLGAALGALIPKKKKDK